MSVIYLPVKDHKVVILDKIDYKRKMKALWFDNTILKKLFES